MSMKRWREYRLCHLCYEYLVPYLKVTLILPL